MALKRRSCGEKREVTTMAAFHRYRVKHSLQWYPNREDGVADATPDVVEMFGLRGSP